MQDQFSAAARTSRCASSSATCAGLRCRRHVVNKAVRLTRTVLWLRTSPKAYLKSSAVRPCTSD